MDRLRIAHLRLLIPFVVVAWRAALPIGDNSFLWHVRAGTLQLETGEVLRADPFSFTALAEAWRTQSWLLELGYGWLENLTGGIGWVPLMKFVFMAVTLLLLGLVVHQVGGRRSLVTFAGLMLLIWQGTPFGVARPALFGFLLLAAVVAVTHMRPRPLWLLPVLFWLWASIHGMFAVGLGYLLLDGLRRKSRRQLIAVVFSGLATALTAHGLGVWWIVLQFLRNRGALELISEWQPPDFSNPFLVPLLLVILAVITAAALGRIAPRDLWLILPFATFGLLAERNVWPAVIVLAPFAIRAAGAIPAAERKARSEAYLINWGIAAALVAVGVIGLVQPVELNEQRFPERAAVAALEPGPLFNGSAVGGYLIYADWPEVAVFIDDRAELYGEEGFRTFHDTKSGVNVEGTFATWGIDQVLVSSDWPIVGYLELLGWEYRYRDDYFVVMGEV
ncbi:MAG: hypothetical protein QNJ89_05545 [Acidimicrobiia bacterium]|nr:hypothetical protein [Acidimicrobiia bacterium]